MPKSSYYKFIKPWPKTVGPSPNVIYAWIYYTVDNFQDYGKTKDKVISYRAYKKRCKCAYRKERPKKLV